MRHHIITATAAVCMILASATAALAGPQHEHTGTLTGRVTDAATSAPVEFATVALIMPDSTFVDGTTTDSTGRFAFNGLTAREYIMKISFIGYKDAVIRVNPSVGSDIGTVSIEPVAEMLDAVVVSARRPVIEQKLDRLIMNVADAVSTEGSNGTDLLRKAPGVTIDFDGNVKLNGSSVEVWIDGRPSNLSGKELEVLLQSTDGTTIDRIEIMAHPSAKYDAAGGGGIINIVTKKNFTQGLNGSVNLSYGGMYFDRWEQAADGSVNLSYRGAKTNTFLTYSAGYDDMTAGLVSESLYGEDYGMKMRSTSNLLMRNTNQMFRVGNDWYMNERNVLGTIVNGTFRNSSTGTYGDNFTEHLMADELLGRLESGIDNTDRFDGVSANLNYTHTFDKTRMQELTVNADYSWYDINNNSHQSDTPSDIMPSLLQLDSSIFRQDAAQNLQILSVKADYQQVFWQTGMLEAGLKWSRTLTDNNSVREDFYGGRWNYSDSLSNLFLYDEQIAAAYISAAKSFGTKWSVKIGLRGEYTWARGDWRSAGEKSTKSYFNIFPTAFFSYMPSKDWRLAVSYTRRISRPGYSQLNPFRTYMSANSFTEGDPDLDPQFSDQVSLSVGYGQHLNLSLLYQHNTNLIMQHPEVNPANGEQRLIWENFGTQSLAGAALSIRAAHNQVAQPLGQLLRRLQQQCQHLRRQLLRRLLPPELLRKPQLPAAQGMEDRNRRLRLRQHDNGLHEHPPDVHALRRHQEEPLGRPRHHRPQRPGSAPLIPDQHHLLQRRRADLQHRPAHQPAENHPLVQLPLRYRIQRPQTQRRQRGGILPRRRLRRHKHRPDRRNGKIIIRKLWEVRISDSNSSPYGTTGAR